MPPGAPLAALAPREAARYRRAALTGRGGAFRQQNPCDNPWQDKEALCARALPSR